MNQSASSHSINTLTTVVRVPMNNYCYVCHKNLCKKKVETHYKIYCSDCWNNEWLKIYLKYHA